MKAKKLLAMILSLTMILGLCTVGAKAAETTVKSEAELRAALAAAASGDTIKLGGSIAVADRIYLPSGITLDGNGYSIYPTGLTNYGNNKLATDPEYAAGASIPIIQLSDNVTGVTIQNLTVDSADIHPRALISTGNNTNLTLRDVVLNRTSVTARGSDALALNGDCTIEGDFTVALCEGTWSAISFNTENETLTFASGSRFIVTYDHRTGTQPLIYAWPTGSKIVGYEAAGLVKTNSVLGSSDLRVGCDMLSSAYFYERYPFAITNGAGTIYYSDFDKALAAAASEETVTLLRDITVEGSLHVPDGKNFILDGQDYTISFDASTATGSTDALFVGDGANGFLNSTMTVKNATIKDTSNVSSKAVTTNSSGVTSANITFDGCTFDNLWAPAYLNPGTGSLTIKNCLFKNNGGGLWCEGDGFTVSVTGCEYQSATMEVMGYGTPVITGNDFSAVTSVSVAAGTVSVALDDNYWNGADPTYTTSSGTTTVAKWYVQKDVLSTPATGADFALSKKHYTAAVAEIDNEQYLTFSAALEAAKNGDEFKVIKDSEGEPTLNIAKKLTLVGGGAASGTAVVATDDVVIMGGSYKSVSGKATVYGGKFVEDPSMCVADGFRAVKEDGSYVVKEIVVFDTEQDEVSVGDTETGVSVTFDTSTGSPMKEILDNAAAQTVVTVDTTTDPGFTTTTTQTVDVSLKVEEKGTGSYSAVTAGGEVVAAFDISLEQVTTTMTVKTDDSDDSVVSKTVSTTAPAPVTYTGGAAKVTLPYVMPDNDKHTTYKVVYDDGSGTKEVMDATYDAVNECFVFFTTHNSVYFIEKNTYLATDVSATFEVALKPISTNTYDIILIPAAGKVINGFASADLTFKLTAGEGNIVYQDGITPNSAAFIKVNDSLRSANRYMFYVHGNDGTSDVSYINADDSITLGTVTFGGYGSNWKFEITKAVINTTTYTDSIVVTSSDTAGVTLETSPTTTLTNPTAIINPLTINPETQKLTINVTFPNKINTNDYSYQAMKVTVSGGDLANPVEVELGSSTVLGANIKDVTAGVYPYSAAAKTSLTALSMGDYTYDEPLAAHNTVSNVAKYQIVLNEILTQNTLYTVEITGKGYRAARYNVMMTGDKTLTFWNNVMDDATVIETTGVTPKDSSAVKVTFLAGDIVEDAQINIYDLSAVVSYFGEVDLVTAKPEYAKYDLNRDGKIDSIDVAYVLVSWGN